MKKFCFLIFLFIVSNIYAETITIVTNSETFSFDLSEIANITFSEDVSVEDMTDIISSIPIKFLKNYPNPFNPRTTIAFDLKSKGKTKLEIYNLKGQKVKQIVNKNLDSGRHEFVWNGKNDDNQQVASGVYFYSLTHKDQSIVNKMIVIK